MIFPWNIESQRFAVPVSASCLKPWAYTQGCTSDQCRNCGHKVTGDSTGTGNIGLVTSPGIQCALRDATEKGGSQRPSSCLYYPGSTVDAVWRNGIAAQKHDNSFSHFSNKNRYNNLTGTDTNSLDGEKCKQLSNFGTSRPIFVHCTKVWDQICYKFRCLKMHEAVFESNLNQQHSDLELWLEWE